MTTHNSALTDSDIKRLRSDTPGCANVMHFNHAGSSLMPRPVIDTVVDHIRLEGEIGGYEAADRAEEAFAAVYTSIEKLIGARPGEIALVENATRAWDMAFYAIPFSPGDRILTSMSEYASNVIAFLHAAHRGTRVDVVPNDDSGQISIPALESMLDSTVRLVAVSHMPSNGGLVQPVDKIGKLAGANGSLFLVDACQTVGQLPIDVAAMNCDFLSATSRKYLRGPRGAGFLYVRRELADSLTPPLIDLKAARWVTSDQFELAPGAIRFENWERNVAGLLGMGKAAGYALEIGLDRIWSTVEQCSNELRAALTAISGVTVRDLGAIRGGIVSFDVRGVDADDIVKALARHKINTVSSSVYSTRFDMESRGLDKVVRASVHYLTTQEEIAALALAISDLVYESRTG